MKIKFLLFALPFMALVTLLTFCTKEPVASVNQLEEQTGAAVDRGGPCQIVISTTGFASICGTTNGAGTCLNCGGAKYVGLANFSSAASHTFGSSMVNGTGSIRNLSNQATTVTVTINGVVTQQVQFAAGQCRDFQFTSTTDIQPCDFVIQ